MIQGMRSPMLTSFSIAMAAIDSAYFNAFSIRITNSKTPIGGISALI